MAASSEKTRSELVVRVATKVPKSFTVATCLGPLRVPAGHFTYHMREINQHSFVHVQYPDNALVHREEFLRNYIGTGKIKVCASAAPGEGFPWQYMDGARYIVSTWGSCLTWHPVLQKDQFDAALAYLGNVGDQPIDWKNFEEEHGVGVEVCVPFFHKAATDNPDNFIGGLDPVRGMRRYAPFTLIHKVMQVSPGKISATVEEEILKVQDKLIAERLAPALILPTPSSQPRHGLETALELHAAPML